MVLLDASVIGWDGYKSSLRSFIVDIKWELFQYVDDIISAREQANNRLRDELDR